MASDQVVTALGRPADGAREDGFEPIDTQAKLSRVEVLIVLDQLDRQIEASNAIGHT